MGKKFEKFIIHIGGDKTGSTSIQRSLRTHREKLLVESDFLYPFSGWHAVLGSFFSKNPEDYIANRDRGLTDRKQIKERDRIYFKNFENALNSAIGAKSIIVSYEGFIQADVSVLEGLRDYGESLANEVIVVVYVRPPISWALSAMSQRVKSGRRPFPDEKAPCTPYRKRLEQVVKVFGKSRVNVRRFDRRSLINGDIVNDFLSHCGVPKVTYEGIQVDKSKTNSSLSLEGLLYGDAVIKEMTRRDLVTAYTAEGFKDRIGQFLVHIPGNRIAISEKYSQELLQRFRGDHDYLFTEFGVDMSEAYDAPDPNAAYDPEIAFPELDNLAKVQVGMLEQAILDKKLLEKTQMEKAQLEKKLAEQEAI
ncbi:MAG: hypothetical protein KDI17_15310 [Halioglobus sp.]|nr:hypothetical protein [Halioglobus sp.]